MATPSIISSQISTANSANVPSFPVASGSGRLLLFFTLTRDDGGAQPSSVTYGAASMTKLAAAIATCSIPRHSIQMWYLFDPAVGTDNITGGSSAYYRAGALYLNDVDTTSTATAFGTPVIMTSANTSTPSVTVSSSSSELVIGAGATREGGAITFSSPASADFQGVNGDEGRIFVGHEAGAASVTIDGTFGGSQHTGMFGIAIKGVAGGGAPANTTNFFQFF